MDFEFSCWIWQQRHLPKVKTQDYPYNILKNTKLIVSLQQLTQKRESQAELQGLVSTQQPATVATSVENSANTKQQHRIYQAIWWSETRQYWMLIYHKASRQHFLWKRQSTNNISISKYAIHHQENIKITTAETQQEQSENHDQPFWKSRVRYMDPEQHFNQSNISIMLNHSNFSNW